MDEVYCFSSRMLKEHVFVPWIPKRHHFLRAGSLLPKWCCQRLTLRPLSNCHSGKPFDCPCYRRCAERAGGLASCRRGGTASVAVDPAQRERVPSKPIQKFLSNGVVPDRARAC